MRLSFSQEDLTKGDKVVYLSPGHAPGMVTTLGPRNNVNVATFEQVMIVSYRPPRAIIVISKDSDTYKNIIDGSEAVIGFPWPEYAQQTYDAGVKLNRNLSELDFINGITTYKSSIIDPPSMEQCWANFECRLYKNLEVGDHNIVVMDILNVTIDEKIIKDNPIATRTSLPALYYTTHGNFFQTGEFTEVKLSNNLKKFDNAD